MLAALASAPTVASVAKATPDAQADILAVEAGLASRSQLLSQNGVTEEDIDREIRVDIDAEKRALQSCAVGPNELRWGGLDIVVDPIKAHDLPPSFSI